MKNLKTLITSVLIIFIWDFNATAIAQNPDTYDTVSLCNLDLNRTATKLTSSHLGTVAPAFKGFVWNDGDNETPKFRPQGITDIDLDCRKYIAVSWYGRAEENYTNRGARISLADVSDMDNIKYRHILLVDENYNTLQNIHAGGLTYKDGKIYVPDTRSGSNKKIYGFDLNDIKRVPSNHQSNFYNYGYIAKRVETYNIPIKPSTLSYDWDSDEFVTATFDKECNAGCTFNTETKFGWFDKNNVNNSSPYHQNFFDKAQGMISMDNPADPDKKLVWFSSSWGRNNPSHIYATEYDRSPNNTQGQQVDTDELQYNTYEFPAGLENMHIEENNQTIWTLTEFTPNEGTGNNRFVFAIDRDDINPPSEVIDQTPPTTDVSVDGDWHTEDFEAVFNDEDEEGGSGVEKGFYHVLYLDEGTWKANATNGFLSDNFEGSAPDSKWTSETGTWEVDDNVLKQTDEAENNSNLHADLTQDLSNRYLYTWQGKITGSGDNRRAGIHFFSDNPTQSNRGNSYFVYFRVDDDEIQIHKVNDNDFVLEESVPHTIVADQWYNFKVSFDRITGEMVVIIDGEIVATWTDSDPHESGISVSFRSGNAQYEVKHFNVYRSRYPEETISVGNDEDKDVQTQNPDPNTPAAKVKSLAMDGAGNISGIASEFVNIDWSAPAITEINDGPDADIDTTYVNTLEGNWEAEDPHSGIDNYQVAIGTEPGEDDVLEWMDNGSETFISHLFEEIENDQVYYISVKAKNGAGLIASSESDGQRYINEDLGTEKNDLKNITLYPNPAKEKLNFQGLREATKVFIYDMNGRLVKQSLQDLNNKTLYLNDLSPGTYHVLLKVNNQVMAKKLIKE